MVKPLLILGGLVGAGALAYIIFGSGSGESQAGGGFGGGSTKKETTTTETTQPVDSGAPIYNIIFESPGFPSFGGAGGFAPDPVTTIADTIYPGDPAGKVYASTRLPGYSPPAGPTKKEQKEAETGFTTRTGGGLGDIWFGGR